jgi:hypothetical protein
MSRTDAQNGLYSIFKNIKQNLSYEIAFYFDNFNRSQPLKIIV